MFANRRVELAFVVVGAFAAQTGMAQRKPVTLEAVAAAAGLREGPSAITWAPDGRRFAYLEKKTIWIYSAGSGERRELLALSRLEEAAVKTPPAEVFTWENRGVTERTIQWSPSGSEMLVRAGGDLFWVHVDTATWEQLTATAAAERDPRLSPDGRRVSFRREHDLYSLEVATRTVTRLTADGSATLLNGELDWVYPEELALPGAQWWSPDSTRVAYLQFDVSREPAFPQVDLLGSRAKLEPQRYPKAGDPNAEVRLGIVPAQGGATRWVDLGDPRDALLARVTWLPDGKGIAVQRLNRIQDRLDLMLADPAGGGARTVLREQDPHWVNVNDHLRFLKDGRHFLWGSERDGFLHLYLCTLDGKTRQITRGAWQVDEVAGVDENRREVFFVSTEQSPLERHLYRVGLEGGRRTRLTAEAGTHAVAMSPDCDYYLDTYSSLKCPPRRSVHSRDGSERSILQEADRKVLEEYEILPTEIVTVKAADGTLLYARMIRPAGFTSGRKYPVVVMVYGGPHAQSVRDMWSGLSWDQALAHRGFLIWQLDNRGSAGRGHGFESPVFRNLGARELEDQREGIRRLASLGFADTSRMAIYGWSYGGFMTLYSLANAPDLFRAGIAGAPVADWRNYDSIYTERYMGLPRENEAGYRRSSPLSKAAGVQAPVMLVHNIEDDNVHFQNSIQMADALAQAGKQYQMLVYPQKAHGVTGPARGQMLEALTRFLEASLK